MKIFKLIEISLIQERKRIDRPGVYNKRQRKSLHKLCDLFESGKWQECLDLVNNKKYFPYNERYEYPETEHISIEIGAVLRELGYENFYTKDQLLDESRKHLAKKS